MAIYDQYSLSFSNLIPINNNAQSVHLTLTPATVANYVLMGQIYSIEATPIPTPITNARIRIVSVPSYFNTIYSDNNGYYHVELPNGGPFLVFIDANGFNSTQTSVSIPLRVPIIKDIALTPQPSLGNTVYGIVSEQDDPTTLIGDADVYLTNINNPTVVVKASKSTDNGEYCVYNLEDGTYTITTYAQGYNMISEDLAPLSSNLRIEKNLFLTENEPL